MYQNLFENILVPFALAITMLGMGLSLEERDFKNVFRRPKALILGVLIKLIVLPLLSFTILFFTSVDVEYKLGFILIAACPGGATTNLLTYLLRGNVALSISMTAINSLIVLISLPVTVKFALIYFQSTVFEIHMPVIDTIINISLLTIVPTIVGIIIRNKRENWANNIENPLRYVLPTILLLVFAGVILVQPKGEGNIVNAAMVLLPIGLLLNVSGMSAGKYLAKLFRLSNKTQFTVAIEVGLQNSALAIFIGGTLLNSSKIALVAVIYSSFTFFSTSIIAYLFKRFI